MLDVLPSGIISSPTVLRTCSDRRDRLRAHPVENGITTSMFADTPCPALCSPAMTASPLLRSSRHAPGTRIRPINYASAAERHAVALLLVRAFVNNKMQRWLGGLERPGKLATQGHRQHSTHDLAGISSSPPTSTSEADVQILPRDVRNLYFFFAAWLATTVISGGRAMVAVEPMSSSTPLNFLHVCRPDDGSSNDHESLLAVALWHAPGSSASSLPTLIRSNQHRTLTGGVSLLKPWNWTGWGISGLYRAIVRTQSAFVKAHTDACTTRGLDRAKCWALESLAADPEAEGKGIYMLWLRVPLSASLTRLLQDMVAFSCEKEWTSSMRRRRSRSVSWKPARSAQRRSTSAQAGRCVNCLKQGDCC